MNTPELALLAQALAPITSRVRTDVTAVKKRNGAQAWTKQELTADRLGAHLNGGPARGVCPIKEGQSVTLVGLLDFDSHGGEADWLVMSAAAHQVADVLALAHGCSPILFRSSGGRGIHLYVLWDLPQDAFSVREMFRRTLEACGLRNGTGGVLAGQVEVFPKQDAVPIGGFGNQFILPLAGASVPLVWEEMAESYIALDRAALLAVEWTCSDEVEIAVRERVPRETVSADSPVDDGAKWRSALAAITERNVGESSLTYDEWRNAVFAIHHETQGSDDGLQLAHALSARSHKCDPAFLEERVWPYVKSEGAGRITGGTLMHMAGLTGWHAPLDEGAFPDGGDEVEVLDDAQVAVEVAGGAGHAGHVGGAAVRIKRGTIPEAQHLCTDQANAQRLVKAYGGHILVAAGLWHVWSGKHWVADEADVYRYACRISLMVKDEAQRRVAALEGEDPKSAIYKQGMAIVAALHKWSTKCEMSGTINAAIGLARKMLTVDAEKLDADPYLLNCANGTVDLRDGAIRPHDYRDLITKLAAVDYVPGSRSELWERTVSEIYSDDVSVIEFAQLWFGYCATGSVREQVFVVHWGGGSNGKSTVVESVAGVLGGYAYTAPPGLMSGQVNNERHPTEIAGLMGKRMVTTIETDEGAKLREAFVKQATGGDRLTARFMREDFFEFMPTHKLQVLQNPKLNTDGTDHGLWRRVRLLPYVQVFGTEDEVSSGRATRLKDTGLPEALRGREMREAILAWIVSGALTWWARGMLPTPDTVMLAGEALRLENDRVGQFLHECCELGLEFSEPLTVPGRAGGLYRAFEVWCGEGGMRPFQKRRFLHELERLVPHFKQTPALVTAGGARAKVQRIGGLRLLADPELGFGA